MGLRPVRPPIWRRSATARTSTSWRGKPSATGRRRAPTWAGTGGGRSSRWSAPPTRPAWWWCVRSIPSAFNGTVIVLWNNVSAGYENFAGGDSPEVYEGGFAYVAVSVQRVGIHGQPDNPQGLRRLGSGAVRVTVDPERRLFVRHLHAGGQSGRSRSTPRRPRPHGRPRGTPAHRARCLAIGGAPGFLSQRCPADHPALRRLLLRDVLRWRHPARGGRCGHDRPRGGRRRQPAPDPRRAPSPA